MSARTTETLMPPEAPLALVEQSFGRRPDAIRAGLPRWQATDLLWRLGAFGPAFALTLSFLAGLARWFRDGGFTLGEVAVVVLIGATFIWVSLSVSAMVLALFRLWLGRPRPERQRGEAQSVALLVPVFNEDPAEVMGRVAAMRAELDGLRTEHRFAFFVLSDTRDETIAQAELRAVGALRAAATGVPVHYRRRATNSDRKIGNLYDWIRRWGAAWDAMIILDADSLMTGPAIRRLADAMAGDPDAALVQSFPVLISAETLFGRMQEFAASVYGWLMAEGLSLWSRNEGNYWGHNAIIRTRAFADSAHLPYLRQRGGDALILSHDFVEAGMLRRAGWAVRFMAMPGGSYEQTPPTLVDYVLRDRRWCRGNLQHLRILAARGFHPISRFHLLQGAMAYLLSPAWFALLILWAGFLPMAGTPESYFSAQNPLFPVWPQVGRIDGIWFLVLVYAMLLLPKIVAAGLFVEKRGVARAYGGRAAFAAAVLTEILLSILYAPILMVQQTRAVTAALLGRGEFWTPQRRSLSLDGWPMLLRFHAWEVAMGAALAWGIASGSLSVWLAPVAISLGLAPALSRLSGLPVAGAPLSFLRLDTPLSLNAPRVSRRAEAERDRLSELLADAPPARVPAE
ncbi:MAG: glucans biosynthesis glucosyltransferase MdoH [Pseudomonadota bacterium]